VFAEDGTELPLNHSVYDPFWAACQELGVPVGFHPGVHVDTPGACRKFGLVVDSPNMMVTNMAMDEIHGGSGLGQAVGNAADMIVTLGRITMGGLCERFPSLKFIALESGGGWVRRFERMNSAGEGVPLEKRWLSLLERAKRQCRRPSEGGNSPRRQRARCRLAGCRRRISAPEYHLDRQRGARAIEPLSMPIDAHPRRERGCPLQPQLSVPSPSTARSTSRGESRQARYD
jgi:hypothetical protein